ncbi:MAG: sigma-54-dependent Fis family transcriptional regulator [Deltaproteobacteria bacterium]|nr:sigma-54-dependent Fis family transcriptional regulator [Deltaproteobacteria bacterium]
MPTALIVDDDTTSRESLSEWVGEQGFATHQADDLPSGREIIASDRIDLALLDLDLPSGSGLELLPDLEKQPSVDVIFVTGYSTVDSAVEAFRSGAVDYLTKPVDLKRLKKLLDRARRTAELNAEIGNLRQELRGLGRFVKLIGTSPPMQHVYDLIERVAPTDATVLVTGETGTGKEVVAQTIHALSRRARSPFVPINCGAVAPTLIESELFRPRARQLHGRRARPQRRVRTRDRRHALPRRDHRDAARATGEAPAHARDGRRATRRRRRRDRDRRARGRRHQRRPTEGGGAGKAARGPPLPAADLPDPPAAAARASRRHPAPRAARGQHAQRQGRDQQARLAGGLRPPAGLHLARQRAPAQARPRARVHPRPRRDRGDLHPAR